MFTESEQSKINEALAIFESKSFKGEFFSNGRDVSNFCRLKMGALEREEFSVMFLSNKNQLISFETMFKGNATSFALSSREVVKRALELNAVSVIFSHNRPSGDTTPEQSNIDIMRKLARLLGEFDIEVLDYIIVSVKGTHSLMRS